MTIGIYSITHRDSGKRYIGKSINIEARMWQHGNLLRKTERHKNCNRHLWNAVQKHGWDAFATEVVEAFDDADEELIAERELFWMDQYQTCHRDHGYNLRRDSSTKMIVHEETRALYSQATQGSKNPNFGNFWSDDQKVAMSDDAKRRHAEGQYGDEWRSRQSDTQRERWKDPVARREMGDKVAIAKQKYDYLQLGRDGTLIRRWASVKDIVAENPEYKWQNIYNVCHGHKPTYRGFIWRQINRAEDDFDILLDAA